MKCRITILVPEYSTCGVLSTTLAVRSGSGLCEARRSGLSCSSGDALPGDWTGDRDPACSSVGDCSPSDLSEMYDKNKNPCGLHTFFCAVLLFIKFHLLFIYATCHFILSLLPNAWHALDNPWYKETHTDNLAIKLFFQLLFFSLFF